jgi:hypothetical protein
VEKHKFRKQYPNAAKLYWEKIEEKRIIAKKTYWLLKKNCSRKN